MNFSLQACLSVCLLDYRHAIGLSSILLHSRMAAPGTATSMEMQDTNADAVKNDTISSDEARIGVEKSDDEVDIPPDGGYGWVVVACLLSMNSFTWGESLLCVVVRAERRQQHHVRRVRVVLPRKQLLCRRIHLSLCLGWRSVGRCSLPHGSTGQLARQDIRLQASHAVWYVDLDSLIGLIAGTVCVVLAQCMAGICKSYATFLVCQGVLFGIGLGMVSPPHSKLC